MGANIRHSGTSAPKINAIGDKLIERDGSVMPKHQKFIRIRDRFIEKSYIVGGAVVPEL